MKTLVRLLLLGAVPCMLTGCESCDECPYPPCGNSHLERVTMQIKTEYITYFTTDIINKESYTDLNGPVCQMEQFGSGTDGELGPFNIYLTCYWSLADGLHSCTEGFITDVDGNMLAITCRDIDNGLVFPADFPLDQAYLCYEIEFTGGTGRFECASGRGVMNCDVKSATNSIVHHLEADLTLMVRL